MQHTASGSDLQAPFAAHLLGVPIVGELSHHKKDIDHGV
jgi:hypothetical protein